MSRFAVLAEQSESEGAVTAVDAALDRLALAAKPEVSLTQPRADALGDGCVSLNSCSETDRELAAFQRMPYAAEQRKLLSLRLSVKPSEKDTGYPKRLSGSIWK